MADEDRVMTLLRAAYEAGRKAALFDQADGVRTRAAAVSPRKVRLRGRQGDEEEWQH